MQELSLCSSKDFCLVYIPANPTNEFHIKAEYVNSSAIAAEMFHMINKAKISDILLAVRLNTSTLLHSRIHWRPELIDDVKVNKLNIP